MSKLPTFITGGAPRSMATMRRAKSDDTSPVLPAPMMKNGRAVTTGMPTCRPNSSAACSAASLLQAYGLDPAWAASSASAVAPAGGA